jgi:hypothetical protein
MEVEMRRSLVHLVLAGLAGLLVGCAGAPQLPPKANATDVEVFQVGIGDQPTGRYRTVAEIRIERPIGTSNSDIIMAAQTEAARLGADALVVNMIRRSNQAEMAARGEEEIILEGMAIYWPERPR